MDRPAKLHCSECGNPWRACLCALAHGFDSEDSRTASPEPDLVAHDRAMKADARPLEDVPHLRHLPARMQQAIDEMDHS